jgi:pimeloyl-ACP methyl ester carboxylesterase
MTIPKRAPLQILTITVMALSNSDALAVAQTRYFDHQDRQYLYEGQHRGGAAFLPEIASPDTAVPLVVFLHGTNSSSQLHLWLGGGGRDLRPLVDRLIGASQVRPFVLAGPSQTKRATLARTLWRGFDLGHFVEDVARATEDVVQIDRDRVIFMGHSGAGCNPSGGLAGDFWTDGNISPLALVSIDPCLDEEMGEAFARRPATVPLSVLWQSALWARAPDQFWSALLRHKPARRVDTLTELSVPGVNPHGAIVPLAFERTLRELLPNDSAPADDPASVPK